MILELNCVGSITSLALLGRRDEPVAHLREEKRGSLLLHDGSMMVICTVGAHRHVLISGYRSVSISSIVSCFHFPSLFYFGNSGLVFVIDYRT